MKFSRGSSESQQRALLVDNALLRAIRYSSPLSTFNEQQRSIKLMILYNGLVLFLLSFKPIFLFFQSLVIHQDISTVDSGSFLKTIFQLHRLCR